MQSAHLDYNGREYGSDVSHYFLTAGYVFDINYELKFKPSLMLKSAFNVSPSLMSTQNFYIWKKLKLEQVIDLKTVSVPWLILRLHLN
jgi:hypothetical protein